MTASLAPPRRTRSPQGFRALVQRELAMRHRGAVLGLLWPLLDPVLLVGSYALVLGGVYRLGDVASARALAAGLLPWTMLAATWVGCATAWPAAGPLLRTLPVEPALVALAPAGAALPGFLLGLAAYLLLLGGSLAGALVMLVLFAGLLFGGGLVLACGSVQVRDLAPAVHPAMRLLFFVSPVLYAPERLPAGLRPWMVANPLAPFFCGWRQVLAEGQLPDARVLCLCVGWLLVVLPLAAVLYPRQAGRVAVLA